MIMSKRFGFLLLIFASGAVFAQQQPSAIEQIKVKGANLLETLFEIKEVRQAIPAIIINNDNKLNLSTQRVAVVEEDPDWGTGEAVDIVFERDTTLLAQSHNKDKKIQVIKNSKKSKKSTTVKSIIKKIKRGEKVGKIRIPFSTYVKIGKKNRQVLKNHVIVKGDDGNDYYPYNGLTAVPIPVSIDTLMSLIAEALEYDQLDRLNYLKGRSIAKAEDITKILQLIESTPFSEDDNIKIAKTLEIDSDTPNFLLNLDVYTAMGGLVITQNNALPRVAIYPKKDDKPHENVTAKKSIALSEFGDFVIIRTGVDAKRDGRVLKEKDKKNHFGGGIDLKSIPNIWFFTDTKMLSNVSQYNSWLQRIKNEKK